MMYKVTFTGQFNKDVKKAIKRGYNLDELKQAVKILAAGESLPPKYRDHNLSGNYKGYRECHISPDWLLIYKVQNDVLVLTLTRTGSHSDLF